MTHRHHDRHDIVEVHLGLFRSPPEQEIAVAEERTMRRLRTEAPPAAIPTRPARALHMKWRFALAAAAVVLAVIVVARPWRGKPLATVVADGVYELVDGSRVEMRPRSELSFERADDGVRIRLHRGGVIVNAAKQRTGHLYVQTKDVTVSVVGTVFIVNAGDEGSRVAVIEGKVLVTAPGTTEKTLGPGEQVATNPSIHVRLVKDEIAWSRNATSLMALLQQSATIPPAITPQNPTARRDEFEVVSIRPRADGPAVPGARGTTAATSTTLLGCSASPVELDARRLALKGINVYTLIATAYGSSGRSVARASDDVHACKALSLAELLTGGPAWIRSDQFDIEARLPGGTPSYSRQQYRKGETPEIYRMLQTLLADRFRLVFRRETRERAAYELVPGKARDAAQVSELAAETIRRSPFANEQWPPGAEGVDLSARILGRTPAGDWNVILSSRNALLGELADRLTALTGRPVLDRTGVTGRFSFDVRYELSEDGLQGTQGTGRPLNPASSASLLMALEEQLGLKLEPLRAAPVEVLIIERVERPSEN
jgi:uncharacterized protein (TIGR03435 family)